MGPDLLSFLSHHPYIRRDCGRHLYGPFSRSTGKTALEPPGTPCQRWQLDHQSEHTRPDCGSLRQIFRDGRRRSARPRSDCSATASAGLQLEHSRRLPTDRLELCMCIDVSRSVTTITVGLWRPQHAAANTSLREGVETMKTNNPLIVLLA